MPTPFRTSPSRRPSSPNVARCRRPVLMAMLALPALLLGACQIQSSESYTTERPYQLGDRIRRPWSESELPTQPPLYHILGGQSVPDKVLPPFIWIPRGGSATVNAWWNPTASTNQVDVQVIQATSVPSGSLTVTPTDFPPKTLLLGAPIAIKTSPTCPDSMFTLYLTDWNQKSGECIVQVSKEKPTRIRNPYAKPGVKGGQSVPDQFEPADPTPTKVGANLNYHWQLINPQNSNDLAAPETFLLSIYALDQLPNSSNSIITLVATQTIICPKKSWYAASIPINPNLPITGPTKVQAVLTASNGDHYLAKEATIAP